MISAATEETTLDCVKVVMVGLTVLLVDCETVTMPSRTTSTSMSCGSPASSDVTSHGPSGAKPSKHFPIAHWLCRRCHERSETSLRIV